MELEAGVPVVWRNWYWLLRERFFRRYYAQRVWVVRDYQTWIDIDCRTIAVLCET